MESDAAGLVFLQAWGAAERKERTGIRPSCPVSSALTMNTTWPSSRESHAAVLIQPTLVLLSSQLLCCLPPHSSADYHPTLVLFSCRLPMFCYARIQPVARRLYTVSVLWLWLTFTRARSALLKYVSLISFTCFAPSLVVVTDVATSAAARAVWRACRNALCVANVSARRSSSTCIEAITRRWDSFMQELSHDTGPSLCTESNTYMERWWCQNTGTLCIHESLSLSFPPYLWVCDTAGHLGNP